MASKPLGPCCFRGFKHEGDPVGEIKTIGDVQTYFSYPTDIESPETAVLLLSDVFGLFNNSKLLADDFAKNQYLAVLPDLFAGDQIDIGDFEAGKVDIQGWGSRHGVGDVDPIVAAVIRYLREELGVKRIVAAGYCYGGKYVARFLKPGYIDSGYSAHPSFVEEAELAAIKGPFSIAAAELDPIFPREQRHKSEEILSKTGQLYQINLYSGVEHGYGIRADLSKPQNKFAKEEAFKQALAWFRYTL
ncbi:dienelactone hydrolase family protein [Cadophora sp. DSE1049]|nr:dienelactone hydrolase family protein [Cadophora sp. DSE1049]